MTDNRVTPQDVCIADAMPFQQHHECRVYVPIADVLHDHYFLPLRGQLYAGDEIVICRYERLGSNRRDHRLLEVATVRVIQAGIAAVRVPLLLMGEVEIIPVDQTAPLKPVPIAAPAPEVRPAVKASKPKVAA